MTRLPRFVLFWFIRSLNNTVNYQYNNTAYAATSGKKKQKQQPPPPPPHKKNNNKKTLEHAQYTWIQIHTAHVQSLIQAFALQAYIL